MRPFWLDESERMNLMLRGLIEAPAQKFLRMMEQHRQLLEPPGYRALREFQDNIAAEAQRVHESLTSGFSSIVGQYEVLKSLAAVEYPKNLTADLERSVRTIQKNLAADLERSIRAFQPPALPFIESFSDQLLSASRNLEALRQFEKTFAGQLLELAHEVAKAAEEEREERVEDLTDFLGIHLAESKRGPISLEGYVQIILTLILYFYSTIAMQQSEKRALKRLDNIEAQLKAITPVEVVERVSELRLVSAASLRVRANPSTESRNIGKLTRNSLVRVINKKKSWAFIEYFNFVEGRTGEGWVAHRFLQELPDDFGTDARMQSTDAEKQAARERFERHFGEVDLGYATGVDNEKIDADLARAYADRHRGN